MEPKLNNDQRMLALRMYAEGLSVGEVRRQLIKEFNITLNTSSLDQTLHAKKHEPFLKAFRENYLAKVKSVPIANKRIRVDDLERERTRLNRLIKENSLTTKSDKAFYLQVVGELRRLIEVAREEMERKPAMFQNVVVEMGDMSDEALQQRKQALIARFRRADGRGASGVEPDSTGVGQEDS